MSECPGFQDFRLFFRVRGDKAEQDSCSYEEVEAVAKARMAGGWVLIRSAVIVTTSSKRERLEGYLDVGEFDLSADDVEAIDRAGKKGYPTVLRSIRSMRSMAGWAGTAIKGLVLVGAGLYLLSEFPKITF